MDVIIKAVETDEELARVMRIREVVFVEGQDVPLDRERDEHDAGARHFIMCREGVAVGCARARVLESGRTAKLERVAVLEEFRGLGLGARLMDYLMDYCRAGGAREVKLHSQCSVRRFYEKMGFRARGEVFMDAGIEHIEMCLEL